VVLHTRVAPNVPRDTEAIRLAVEKLNAEAFKSSGQQNAVLSILAEIDALIADGDLDDATRKLENLERRVDGCGTTPDVDDWIVDCAAQTQVRAEIAELIAALRS
jgi:hypothetical protein